MFELLSNDLDDCIPTGWGNSTDEQTLKEWELENQTESI